MSTKDVAIVFDDITEFNTMLYGVQELNRSGITYDIIVPFDSGYADLPQKTAAEIQKNGYKVLTDAPKNTHYKILLTPYPGIKVVERMDYDYHIKYCYGALSAKPNPVYLPYQKIQYHAFMLFNNYELELYQAYGAETYFLPFWRYKNFKKKKHSGKPVLLILPTFGDVSCIDLLKDDDIKAIKHKYKIIAKSHHALDSNPSEEKRLSRLKDIADVCYDSNAKIEELLAMSDVVLSDNSGAIFEALYARIPVAILAEDPNARKIAGLDTYHSRLINAGILPYTNRSEYLGKIIDEAIDKVHLQATESKKLFEPKGQNKAGDSFTAIIREYLNRNPAEDYRKILHDILISEYTEDKKENLELRRQISDLLNSNSWKMTRPVRNIINILKRKDK